MKHQEQVTQEHDDKSMYLLLRLLVRTESSVSAPGLVSNLFLWHWCHRIESGLLLLVCGKK
jgi:hypothetical protein